MDEVPSTLETGMAAVGSGQVGRVLARYLSWRGVDITTAGKKAV
jgi:saccharopine dehydrogenase-like NADP-dependent oxidoreductase